MNSLPLGDALAIKQQALLDRLRPLLSTTQTTTTSPKASIDSETSAELPESDAIYFNQPLTRQNLDFLLSRAREMGLFPVALEKKDRLYAIVYKNEPPKPEEDSEEAEDEEPEVSTEKDAAPSASPQPNPAKKKKKPKKKKPNSTPQQTQKDTSVSSNIADKDEFKNLDDDGLIEHMVTNKYAKHEWQTAHVF